MHILLTDIITCPRCGPAFGLIVLADRLEDRRVIDGRLGCANCRESYEVGGGVADLRRPSAPPLPQVGEFESDEERIFRAAALLGVTTPNATVLIVEPTGAAPAAVSGVMQGAHVIGASRTVPDSEPPVGGVLSQTLTGETLPLRDRSVHGVALLGTASDRLIDEGVRVLMPGARIVLDPAPEDAAERLREIGLTVHLEQEGVVVAGAPGPR